MKTRRKKAPGFTPPSSPAEPGTVKFDDGPRGFVPRLEVVEIAHEDAVAVTARFHEVPTAELLVVEDMGREYTRKEVEDRFVKIAPRIPATERDSFDGAAAVRVFRAAGARAVVLAPIMVPEVRRVEPEQVVKRTPRETVRAWFAEQKAIDAKVRDAALELVVGFMDEENM